MHFTEILTWTHIKATTITRQRLTSELKGKWLIAVQILPANNMREIIAGVLCNSTMASKHGRVYKGYALSNSTVALFNHSKTKYVTENSGLKLSLRQYTQQTTLMNSSFSPFDFKHDIVNKETPTGCWL